MIRRLAVTLALLLAAAPAVADMAPPVTVKLLGVTAPARQGQPFSCEVLLTAKQTATLSSFSITSPFQTDVITHDAPSSPVLLSGRVNTRTLHISLTPTGPRPGFKLLFLANGTKIVREFDLSADRWDLATRPATLAPVPATVVIPESPSLRAPDARLQPVEREVRIEPVHPIRAAQPMAVEGAAGSGSRTVRGRFVYVRDDGETLPVDGMTVRIYDEDWDWDEHLGTTLTGVDGRYQMTVPVSEDEPDLYVEFESASSRVVVEDDYLEFNYIFRTGVKDDFSGSTADFGTLQPSSGIGRAVCHIFTNITRGWRELAGNGWDTPSVDVQYPSSDWPHYDSDGEIHIPLEVEGVSHGWRAGTHLHEYGHHVMKSFFYTPDNTYDNGVCNKPSGDPGHCTWCEEDDGTAIKEGFADFVSDMVARRHEDDYGHAMRRPYNREALSSCGEGAAWGNEPQYIEGYFAALLRDINDSENEDEPMQSDGEDQLTVGYLAILEAMNGGNHQGPNGFINEFLDRNPNLSKTAVWNTFANNGFDLDEASPGTSPYFESTSHNEGAQYPAVPDKTIDMTWQASSDDWSGAVEYSLQIAASPTMPDASAEVTAGQPLKRTLAAPSAGSWYITLRARDATGKWSSTYNTAGPYRIRDYIPADLGFALFSPSGWDGAVVMRTNTTATTSSATSATFMTDGQNTYWNMALNNFGELGAGSTRTRFLVDGVQLDSVTTSNIGGGGVGFSLNQGPVVVDGGRHTVEVWADGAEQVAETEEDNNHASRQYVWDASRLDPYTIHTMPSPPDKDAGHDALPIGTSGFDNCYGFEISHVYTPPGGTISGTTSWTGVSAHPLASSFYTDIDLRVFNTSTSTSSGFGFARSASSRGSGLLDAVFTNRTVNLDNTWDVGVYRDGVMPVPYRVQQEIPRGIQPGDSIEVTLAQDQMMKLYQFDVDADELGSYLIEVRGAPAYVNNITTLWFDDSHETAGIEDYDRKATSDLYGRSTLLVPANDAGVHLIALYRNPSVAQGPVTFGLKLRLAQPDVRPFTSYEWTAPLVPRRTDDASPGPATVTSTLTGDGTTYMNVSIRNDGSVTAGYVETDILWDGVRRTGPNFVTVSGQSIRTGFDTAPTTIPGGRHTLWLETDPDDDMEESDESDNVSGRQWVFAPPVRSLNTPTWRKHGRSVDAGWTTLPEDEVVFFNQDALRTPTFTSGMGYQWAGVALMPIQGSDMDLWLHEKSTGSTDGFESPLTTSDWGTSVLDYALIDFSNTAYRGFDAGMLRVDVPGVKDTAQYVSEVVGAQTISNPFAGVGSTTMGPGQLMDLYTLPLTFGSWTIRLVHNSHGAPIDWGIALHKPGQSFQNRTDGRDRADWMSGPGLGESITFNVDQPGDYALAVFKAAAQYIDKSGIYSIVVTSSSLDADPGAVALRTGLHSAAPDPFVHDVRFGIELAEAADLQLDIHDVTGARRRVLAQGPWAAGRHSLVWDGRDEGGRAVPPGLYLVRMVAGGKVSTTKVVRTR